MKKIFHLLFLAPLIAFAQPSPPSPAAATQTEVNAGVVPNKYVSPKTLAGWTGGGGGGGTPGGLSGDWQKNVAGSFAGVTPTTGWDTLFSASTSANLFGWITDETGSGVGALLVFNSSPTIASPTLTGTTTVSTMATTTLTASTIEPTTNDGAALGSTSKQFSDLFLAEGGVINWDNGDATLTQVSNVVTLAGAVLAADIGTSTATTASAGDATTKVATTAYADTAARGTHLGTFASPNTAAGAITWVSPVYHIFTSAGATRTYTLPAASSYPGQAVILYVAVGTGHVNFQPASGAQLVLAGTLLTANHYIQCATSAAGNYMILISDGTNWVSLGYSGTWTDASSA